MSISIFFALLVISLINFPSAAYTVTVVVDPFGLSKKAIPLPGLG